MKSQRFTHRHCRTVRNSALELLNRYCFLPWSITASLRLHVGRRLLEVGSQELRWGAIPGEGCREPKGSSAKRSHCPWSSLSLPWAMVGLCGHIMWSPGLSQWDQLRSQDPRRQIPSGPVNCWPHRGGQVSPVMGQAEPAQKQQNMSVTPLDWSEPSRNRHWMENTTLVSGHPCIRTPSKRRSLSMHSVLKNTNLKGFEAQEWNEKITSFNISTIFEMGL